MNSHQNNMTGKRKDMVARVVFVNKHDQKSKINRLNHTWSMNSHQNK
jgi:ribosomal protein S9